MPVLSYILTALAAYLLGSIPFGFLMAKAKGVDIRSAGSGNSIGMALYEKVVWRDGLMANGQMTNYIMPTAADIPPIRVFFEEQPYAFGPHGAKGIGELPVDGPAPAILNAIENATGICVREMPATPENLMDAMTASMTGRGGPAPVSSGPEARAAPVTATAIPTHAVTLGCSPVSSPRNTGTSAPSDEIGATTPIVPEASAV